jgi:hypothetical protein
MTIIRCFDLGGSGLKTCVYKLTEGKYFKKIIDTTNLGHMEPNDDPPIWIRKKIQNLDKEIDSNYSFSFCLAGLDKLWGESSNKLPKTESMSSLFYIPKNQVYQIKDQESHLLAALSTLNSIEHPIANICIGTGIAISMTNKHGKVIKEKTLDNQFNNQKFWDLNSRSKSSSIKQLWFSLTTKGLDELENRLGKTEGLNKYRTRWENFINEEFLNYFEKEEKPKMLILSGGVTDKNHEKFIPFSCGIEKVIAGPKDAGLLGAAFHVFNYLPYKVLIFRKQIVFEISKIFVQKNHTILSYHNKNINIF